MKTLKLLIGFLIIILFQSNSGCERDSNKIETEKQEKLLKEAGLEIGMPNIINFKMKKDYKMIQELCDDEKLICYAYTFSEMTGKMTYIGQCQGYGIPYATQFTSPSKKSGGLNTGSVIPQADPNGLYMPASADATWLLMIDPKTGKVHPVYFEPKIIVSPFKLTE